MDFIYELFQKCLLPNPNPNQNNFNLLIYRLDRFVIVIYMVKFNNTIRLITYKCNNLTKKKNNNNKMKNKI